MSHITMTAEQYRAHQARVKNARSAPTTIPEKVSPAKAKTGHRTGSKIEELFAAQIKAAGLPEPTREYQHIPGRCFRLDFAWADRTPPLGVEVQGQVHRIKGRFEADLEKRNLGTWLGWDIYEFSGQMIRSGEAIEFLQHVFIDTPAVIG